MASLDPQGGMLGKRLAKHLLNRTSWNITRTRINSLSSMTANQAVDTLLTQQSLHMSEPIDPETGLPWINGPNDPISSQFRLRYFVAAWWAHEALLDKSIGHKMEFFLHTNFTVSSLSQNSEEFFDYLALLRYYSLGNLRELAEKIIYDNLMLDYLDNKLNTKNNPNENFAREYLELFTINKGDQVGPGDYTNFTEQDVAEASRLLTGTRLGNRDYDIDPYTGIPAGVISPSRHDTGDKTFSYAFQNRTIQGGSSNVTIREEISEFVDMIFEQDETARAYCRKLYRFFVSRFIDEEIENDIIEPLAEILRDNDYDIKATLSTLLKSKHFFDTDDSSNNDEIIGGLIKSPLDLFQNSLSFFKIDIPNPILEAEIHYNQFYRKTVMDVIFPQSGFSLFQPSSVAGYPAYYQQPDYNRSWFNPSTIIARYKLPEILLTGRRVLSRGQAWIRLDVVKFIEDRSNISNPLLPDVLVSELLEHLLSEIPDPDRLDYFLNEIFLNELPAADWTYEWEAYENTGDDTEVRIPLENLITAIMYSPEFQVF